MISLIFFCSARGNSTYVREKDKSDSSRKSQKSQRSEKKSKRAKPLDPEEMIPLPEETEKNPDIGKTIDSRSQKSRTLKKSNEMKGFVLERDKSVRRLEDNSRYHSQTSLRCKKQDGEEQDPAGKPPSERKSKKSQSRKSRRNGEVSLKKKDTSAPKPSKKSKKSKREVVKSEKKDVGGAPEEKPKRFRKPWKSIFKLKRKKREQGSVNERVGTWA